MESKTIRFVRRGELVSLANVPPERTLLELLREDLACTGTKEGCGEGDCGACTVVLAEPEDGALKYRAINACIRLAHSIDGMALWTVEDLAGEDGGLHPPGSHGAVPRLAVRPARRPHEPVRHAQNHVCQGSPSAASWPRGARATCAAAPTGHLDAAQQMERLPRVEVDRPPSSRSGCASNEPA
jgi:xanthine dehydrogenase small subunit